MLYYTVLYYTNIYITTSCSILFIFDLLDIMYAVEIENNTKSDDPLTNNGVSDFI